jgi:hypothetical protein
MGSAPFISASPNQVAIFENCHRHSHAQIYRICPPELISAGMLMTVYNGGYLRGWPGRQCGDACARA